jgi:hypothetical protein
MTTRSRWAPLASIVVLATLFVPSAQAKLRLSMTTEPERPIARDITRIEMRTDSNLTQEYGIRLFVVGPWRKSLGQASFEVRLVRIAQRRLRGHIRFPHAGRWHLSVPASAASGAGLDRWVRVLPPA